MHRRGRHGPLITSIPTDSPSPSDIAAERWDRCERIFGLELQAIIGMENLPLARWVTWDDEDYYKRQYSDDEGWGENEEQRIRGKRNRQGSSGECRLSNENIAGTCSEITMPGWRR